MSDFRDTIKTAIEKGFYLDSCGSDERHYSWGLYTDLCGMSVEDAIPVSPCPCSGGGDDSGKTKNTVTFSMAPNGSGNYTVRISAAHASPSDFTASFSVNGQSYLITVPAGITNYDTEISGEDPSKPYATISDVSIFSESETFTYKNSVKTGDFKLTIINDGIKTESYVKYGTEYTLPEVEERTGYNFIWRDSSGQEITGTTIIMPESDTTITGTYEAKEHTLSYIVREEIYENGVVVTETSGSTTVLFGRNILEHLNGIADEKEGHTLRGWHFSSDDTAVLDSSTMPDEDIEVNNLYVLNVYNVTYISDGSQFAEQQYYYGQETSPIGETPEKTGYNFIGWDTELPATMPASDITITALFEAIIYYIRYYVDGVETYSDEHIYGDEITIREPETREGYTFSGWDAELPTTMPANDIDVNGTFTINTYTLSCVADDVTIYTRDYDYGIAIDVAEIPTPTKKGYTFSAWSEDVPETMPATDVTLIAEFTINQYVLSYYVDGNLYTAITYDYAAEITPEEEPTREGFTFSGWDSVPATMPANDVDVNGTFTVNQYTLSFFVDGEPYSSITGDYGSQVPEIEEPSREGYTFSGWDNEIPATIPASDLTFNGSLIINTHTVTYFVDGTEYSSQTYNYGEQIIPLDEPTKEGYTFSGWDSIPATMPDNDVTVNGTFTVNQYTLSFIVDDEPYSSITADYGTQVPAIEEPSREGYTFSGWDKEIPQTIPAEDVEFRGSMLINSYIADYIIDDEPYSSVTYEFGQEIEYPDVPKSGYTFSWDIVYSAMPASDITIYGTYTEIQEAKTIYYGTLLSSDVADKRNVSGLSEYDYVSGEEVTESFVIPGNPEYEIAEAELDEDGFEEWCIEHDYSYYIVVPTSAILKDVKNGPSSIRNTFVESGVPFTVDGNEYQAYVKSCETCCISTDITYTLFITIEKK